MSAATPGMRRIWVDAVVHCVDQRVDSVTDVNGPSVGQSLSNVDSVASKSDLTDGNAMSLAGKTSTSLQTSTSSSLQTNHDAVPANLQTNHGAVSASFPTNHNTAVSVSQSLSATTGNCSVTVSDSADLQLTTSQLPLPLSDTCRPSASLSESAELTCSQTNKVRGFLFLFHFSCFLSVSSLCCLTTVAV